MDLLSDEDAASSSQEMSHTESIETGSVYKLTTAAESLCVYPALQKASEFDIDSGILESVVTGEYIEKVAEVRNVPNNEETSTSKQLVQQKVPNDENTVISNKLSKKIQPLAKHIRRLNKLNRSLHRVKPKRKISLCQTHRLLQHDMML